MRGRSKAAIDQKITSQRSQLGIYYTHEFYLFMPGVGPFYSSKIFTFLITLIFLRAQSVI